MSALAIHPSPRTRRNETSRPRSGPCPQPRSAPRALRHLSLVPAPAPRVERPVSTAGPSQPATPIASLAPEVVIAPVAQPRLRLTTRGRRVLIALGFALSIAIGGTVGIAVQGGDVLPQEVTTVTVQPGQSLWVIASESAVPGQDVREVIDQIRTLNGLEQSTIHAGQELNVPVG